MTTRRGSNVTYWIGKAWLKAFGWRLETEYPVTDKFVLIAAPHTTGWDLPFMLATSYAMRMPLSWMGKMEQGQPVTNRFNSSGTERPACIFSRMR